MRIAFVSFYEAYPATSGAASVTYNCALLAPGTSLLVQLAGRECVEQIEDLTIVSLKRQESSRLKKMVAMPGVIAQIAREVAEFRPGHVVIEGASWAVYLLFLAVALRRSLPGVKIIYHAHNVEYLLRQERNGRSVAALTKIAERKLLSICDMSFACSEDDRRRFQSIYGILPGLLPNGVDCGALDASDAEIDTIRRRLGLSAESILFMGLYAYPPNTEAVRFLMEQVMPALYRERPEARLVLTGGAPPDSPPWLIKAGVLPRRDLNAVLRTCRVGVAPIFRGSGTRIKILEYMAAGLPVVATKKGAEGLNLENGKHLLYAESPEEFQVAILRLLCDQPQREKLSAQAEVLVKSRFDWTELLRTFALQLQS